MQTAGAWAAAAARRLSAAGVERPLGEARSLLAALLEATPARLFAYPETPLPAELSATADAWLERRARGEPLARILGQREFWSLPFLLGPETLEPRPDTEVLVEAALAAARGFERPRILDLGVGSGCVLLALLHELPSAWGVGVDRASGAASVAAANARALQLHERAAFVAGDWGDALRAGAFDLVVSNPPYIALSAGPAPDANVVAHDPGLALWGGADGLDAYRALSGDMRRLLAPEGLAFLEIGAGQADAVAALFHAAGMAPAGKWLDLSKTPRCLAFRRE